MSANNNARGPSGLVRPGLNMFLHNVIDGHVLFKPKGDLTFFNVAPFSKAINDALAKANTTKVIIDCAGLNMLDSAALGELVQLGRKLHEQGGGIKLANVGTKGHQSIYSIGIENMIATCDSVEDALKCDNVVESSPAS